MNFSINIIDDIRCPYQQYWSWYN